MKTWTVQEMIVEGPCEEYTEARLRALWAGREALSLLDVLDLDIPCADKVWVCCRDHPHREAWLERVVTRALHSGIEALEAWAAKWLSGQDRSVEAAERASGAAWAAAEVAAWAAERARAEREAQVQDMRNVLRKEILN